MFCFVLITNLIAPTFCETTEWLEEGAKISISGGGVSSGNKFIFRGFDDGTLTITKEGTNAEFTGISFLSSNVKNVDVFLADETGKVIHTFGKSIVGDVSICVANCEYFPTVKDIYFTLYFI